MTKRPIHNRGRRLLIDRFRIGDIPKTKALFGQRLQYEWEKYSEIAFQRAQILDDLKKSLAENATGPFRIDRWQRAVKYKYALTPLSAQGSLVEPGGRFNIGRIDTRFPEFPALYLAKTKDTAMDELLSRDGKGALLEPEQMALTRRASIAVVAISGELEAVFDVRNEKSLTGFVQRTRHFTLSEKLKNRAKELGLPIPGILRTEEDLKKSLLDPNWRFLPMQMDIPSNPQIFGQIVMEAGINGILYPSVLNGEDCLAVFPKTFADSTARLEIADDSPNEIKFRKIDSKNFNQTL